MSAEILLNTNVSRHSHYESKYFCWWCTCSDDISDDDVEDTAGRNIRSWSDADVRWVTDELAQRIKVAAAATANDSQEPSSLNDVAVHAPLSQTVQLSSFVVMCIN